VQFLNFRIDFVDATLQYTSDGKRAESPICHIEITTCQHRVLKSFVGAKDLDFYQSDNSLKARYGCARFCTLLGFV
jgi:hypothetical protein